MKKILLFLFLSGFIAIASAQESLNLFSLERDASTSTWHLFRQSDNVRVFYQYLACGPVEYVFFKVENTGAAPVTVALNFTLYNSSGTEMAANPDDTKFRITIDSQSSLHRSCNGGAAKLGFFVKEEGGSFLISSIKLSSLVVTPE